MKPDGEPAREAAAEGVGQSDAEASNRIAELDAIAWNIPRPRVALRPPEDTWSAEDAAA